MKTKLAVLSGAIALTVILGFALGRGLGQAAKSATAPKVPAFNYDGASPKLPLPNAWTFEGVKPWIAGLRAA